jgi:branched-chain amino acid transport system ATP-binding protein
VDTVSDGASLEVKGIDVRYGQSVALSDVTFSAPAGSVTALLGANGAGKSSVARAVASLVHVRAGKILLDGIDTTRWPADRVRRAGLAYVPEGRGIFPGLSVLDNLRMAAQLAGGHVERAEAIERAFELFPVLAARRRQRAGSLSGGEQQMLGLARALAVQPRLIVADEMSLGLAPLVVTRVFECVQAIREQGITMIVIEQFVHRALALADQCVILARGTVAWQGLPADAGPQILDRYLGEREPGLVLPSLARGRE